MEETKEEVEQEDENFCDWCGKNPTYIGVYKNGNYDTEVFICKECYHDNYD